jgi:hypothetical protein
MLIIIFYCSFTRSLKIDTLGQLYQIKENSSKHHDLAQIRFLETEK